MAYSLYIFMVVEIFKKNGLLREVKRLYVKYVYLNYIFNLEILFDY